MRFPSSWRGLVCSGLWAVIVSLAPAEEMRASGNAKTVSLLERAFEADEGKNRVRDASTAAELYKAAAASGDALAHFRLGYLYETGDGVPFDPALARKHYEAGVAGGVEEARLRLALCHLEGWGGPVDRVAFLREVTRAAEVNYQPAQLVLAALYFSGFVAERDEAKAVGWLERAAKKDNPQAQLWIGKHLQQQRMRALMPDFALARKWYALSAQNEYAEAMRAAGESFLLGSKGEQNWELARRWLELATETGDAEAPFLLAQWQLLQPAGKTGAQPQAKQWLELAAERGSDNARNVLRLAERGRSLSEAMVHLHTTAYEDRYIELADTVSASEVDRVPKVTRVVKPLYPQSLRFFQDTGSALVDFVVNADGNVVAVKVLETDHPLFGKAAVEAVAQWKFEPAIKGGKAVNTRMRVPLHFELDDSATPLDQMLTFARERAQIMGEPAQRDAVDLLPAALVLAPPLPLDDGGQHFGKGTRALLLLALDEKGVPQRGHVLHAEPEVVGEPVLAAALHGVYRTRVRDGISQPTNIVLPFMVAPSGARGWGLQK